MNTARPGSEKGERDTQGTIVSLVLLTELETNFYHIPAS